MIKIPSTLFPQNLNFIPIHGIKFFRDGAGGAWKLFVLAKNLAKELDHIERETVCLFARSLGIHPKTLDRWMNAARNLGFVSDAQRETGEWILVLISHENVAKMLGYKNKRFHFVSLPSKLLVGKGWKSYVFAAWQSQYTNNGEKLVSQKKQCEITGISEQVQRHYNKEAGVISKANYAISNIHANGYSAVLEFGNRAGLFKFWDKKTHQMYLGWRIPNTRKFPLFGAGGSRKTRGTMSLFNKTAAQYSSSKKALRKTQPKFREVYVFFENSQKGNGLWIHSPLS